MGWLYLVSSPIQFRLANQSWIFTIDTLEQIEVDLEWVNTYAGFEVIEILDDKDPYPTRGSIGFLWLHYL